MVQQMSNDTNEKSQQSALKQHFFSLPTLISFVVAITVIYLLTTSFDLDWNETWGNIRSINPGLYLLALLLYYLSFWFRGLRWRTLAHNSVRNDSSYIYLPSILTFSQLILVGWFVNAIAWLRLGDAYRAYSLSNYLNKSFSWSIGTVFAERAMDMITIFALILIGIGLFSFTRNSTEIGHLLIASIFMVTFLGILLILMRGYGAKFARILPKRIELAYLRFHQGALGSLKQIPLVFGLGLVGWLLEIARLYLVVQALNISADFPLILIVSLGHAILSTVPTPGGIGAVEPGMTGLLMLGMLKESAVSITLIDRSITYLSIIVLGGLAFLMWQYSNSRKRN